LTHKRALVTGASEGVGRATVLLLAEEGCDVAFCARRAGLLEELAAEVRERFGRRAVPVPTDLMQLDQIERLVARAVEELGGLDVVVNNAGSSVLSDDFLRMPDEQVETDLRMKLLGYVRVARAALPHMGPGGVIVNVAGVTGKFPFSRTASGGMANAGVLNFTGSFCEIAGERGVRVVGLAPGGIDTNRFDRVVEANQSRFGLSFEETRRRLIELMPLKRLPPPEEAAGVIAFLASERAANINGTTIVWDGGLNIGL
jgi:3-oxoacyl-[acyl-carrier protein] reductase